MPGPLDAMFLGSAYYAPGGPGAAAPAAVAYYATGGATIEPIVTHPPNPPIFLGPPITDGAATDAAIFPGQAALAPPAIVTMDAPPPTPDLVSLGLAHPLWLLGGALVLYWLVVKA